ncbi:Outer membrane lipoprotein omp16 precursor [hydrothermal vent metagenome]|uniref:Outer membrane lipoprotein omp16 n=1 Tax=hydrothermal vent metagenome TaxID=652676 RepID=A0A1W1BSP4_9ZZZZ
MIKKIVLTTATLSLLLLTGCGQTAPDLDGANTGKNNVSDATQIAGDTVTIDENRYGNQNSADSNSSGKYNSSSDGFQSVYFAFGDYGIAPGMESRISTDANVINSSTASKIKIEGNCDEFGTDEYNYALGLKRAKAVKDSLSAQGIAANRMVIVSFGESNPVCSSPTDSCYERNRRVDLHLVK